MNTDHSFSDSDIDDETSRMKPTRKAEVAQGAGKTDANANSVPRQQLT
jgi:hypothetical protein